MSPSHTHGMTMTPLQRLMMLITVLSSSLALLAGPPALALDPAKPDIVPRAAWGAAPANEALMRRQTAHAIIIHHTGEKQNRKHKLETKLKNLQSFSMNPGTISGTGKKKPAWGDVPYHFYIDLEGRTGEARSVAFAGDTNTGYKTDGFIQVVLEGHFDSETPTPQQFAALDALVVWLAATYKVAGKDITGHNDHAPSDCPGKKLKAYLDTLRTKADAAQAKP